jgi:hypothetical protein
MRKNPAVLSLMILVAVGASRAEAGDAGVL